MSTLNDLPPRTWRGWWLDRPKWLRIGIWAGLGLLLLHLAVAARIAVGLIEDQKISRYRANGSTVFYPWRNNKERFPGEWLLMDGLMGRSARNVFAVVLLHETDEQVVSQLAADFPNLEVIAVQDQRIPDRSLRTWQHVCRGMARNRTDFAKPLIIRESIPEDQ